MFEVRCMPNWHGIGTNLVRKIPPTTFTIVNFLRSQMVGMIFVCKIIHMRKSLRFDQFQSYSCGTFRLVFSTSSWADGHDIPCFLASSVTVPVMSPFLEK